MMIPFLVTRAVAAVTATLAASCAQNMWQTYQVIQTTEQVTKKNDPPPSSSSSSSSSSFLFSKDCSSVDEAVGTLQQLNRKEFLQLYCTCDSVTDLSSIQGDWDAVLLDNNGWLMTFVSNFMTHQLFSLGPRRWCGKSFSSKDKTGANLFQRTDNNNNINHGIIEREHRVDYALEPSFYGSNKLAVSVKYKNYQNFFSLWRTMLDEIKVLRSDYADGEVLIGMGCMAWSGGFLNGSPFCLYRKTPSKSRSPMTVDNSVEKLQPKES